MVNKEKRLPRHKRRRCVRGVPGATFFKPRGIPMAMLEQAVLSLDEFEALRLADFESRYHEDAAVEMGISRATFGRVLSSARRKVADALVHGKAVVIQHLATVQNVPKEGKAGGSGRSGGQGYCPTCGRPLDLEHKGERICS